ncbi:hypothetical protein N7468_000610 [Penicillium chermesinum]|uniref:Rpr2-domain-containing protein n=1 Tax=Penicillium chermesinum TaxID=63820 RepID=A0A9W9PNN3_9EURO|nr:uncharacterized protein N7468_000610 [Penicillium chermesinum]KAJ5249159.1 hypothetical protein N7468_000610 [Penicillium chermesinum]KAJ6151255.1 hypothetical protein N7470_007849 [Penicillium chermesinum]
MAKPKESKNAKSHLKARLDFLQQASQYLHNCATKRDQNAKPINLLHDSKDISLEASQFPSRMETDAVSDRLGRDKRQGQQDPPKQSLSNVSRMCISQMRGVSLKSQTRLPVLVKRSFCKRCDSVLDLETTAVQEIENKSKGRKKPWAEVRVVRCLICGTEKRFPIAGKRSQRLALRDHTKHRNETGPS